MKSLSWRDSISDEERAEWHNFSSYGELSRLIKSKVVWIIVRSLNYVRRAVVRPSVQTQRSTSCILISDEIYGMSIFVSYNKGSPENVVLLLHRGVHKFWPYTRKQAKRWRDCMFSVTMASIEK